MEYLQRILRGDDPSNGVEPGTKAVLSTTHLEGEMASLEYYLSAYNGHMFAVPGPQLNASPDRARL